MNLEEILAYNEAAKAAFIPPKNLPCNHIDCLDYNEQGQCPDCGWLRPLKGDSSSWGNAMREMPMGPHFISPLHAQDAD